MSVRDHQVGPFLEQLFRALPWLPGVAMAVALLGLPALGWWGCYAASEYNLLPLDKSADSVMAQLGPVAVVYCGPLAGVGAVLCAYLLSVRGLRSCGHTVPCIVSVATGFIVDALGFVFVVSPTCWRTRTLAVPQFRARFA